MEGSDHVTRRSSRKNAHDRNVVYSQTRLMLLVHSPVGDLLAESSHEQLQ